MSLSPRSLTEPSPADLLVCRLIAALRLAGHDFDTIAMALGRGAVDALASGGFRPANLDGGVRLVVEAMREHADTLRAMDDPAPRRGLTLLAGGAS